MSSINRYMLLQSTNATSLVPTGSSVSLWCPSTLRGLLKDAPLGARKVDRLPLSLPYWDRISEGYQAAHLNEGRSQQEPAEQSYYYQCLSCAALTLP